MRCWQGSCNGAILVLLIGGVSLIFFVPFGGAMIAANSTLCDRLTARGLCPNAIDYSSFQLGGPGCLLAYILVYLPSFFLNDSVSAGTIWNRSPTTPYRATLKIGASASLLIATTVFAARIPAKC